MYYQARQMAPEGWALTTTESTAASADYVEVDSRPTVVFEKEEVGELELASQISFSAFVSMNGQIGQSPRQPRARQTDIVQGDGSDP